MIRRFLLFLLLVSSLNLDAQSKYKEGLVVTNAGDTLKGYIDYRGWRINPETILFKSSDDSKDVSRFGVHDLKWFSVPGYHSYAAFRVSVSLNSVEFGALGVALDTTREVKVVFLQEVLRGDKVALYSYTDKLKERLYIMNHQENSPRELIYGKTLRDLQESEHAEYKKQLLTIAMQHNALTVELNRSIHASAYSESSIKGIISQINNVNEQHATPKTVRKNTRINYFVNVGIAKHKLRYSGKSLVTVNRLNAAGVEQFKDEVTSESTSPVLSGGVNLFTNPITRRIVIRGELSVSKIESATTSYSQYNYVTPAGTENTYNLSIVNIALSPQVLYNFYIAANVNCYLGAGFAFNLQRTNKNRIEQKRINQASTGMWVQDDYFHMKSTNLTGVLRGGVQLFDRFDCAVIWSNPTKYTAANSAGQSIQSGLLIFSVGYLMNKSSR